MIRELIFCDLKTMPTIWQISGKLVFKWNYNLRVCWMRWSDFLSVVFARFSPAIAFCIFSRHTNQTYRYQNRIQCRFVPSFESQFYRFCCQQSMSCYHSQSPNDCFLSVQVWFVCRLATKGTLSSGQRLNSLIRSLWRPLTATSFWSRSLRP